MVLEFERQPLLWHQRSVSSDKDLQAGNRRATLCCTGLMNRVKPSRAGPADLMEKQHNSLLGSEDLVSSWRPQMRWIWVKTGECKKSVSSTTQLDAHVVNDGSIWSETVGTAGHAAGRCDTGESSGSQSDPNRTSSTAPSSLAAMIKSTDWRVTSWWTHTLTWHHRCRY